MSRVKRTFTPEQKTKIVLEAIKGEKQINQLATENNIQPNLIRNWKKEFLEHASLVFDEKRDENIRDKLDETRKEKDAYARKVGQLTMQVDWLKKKSEEVAGPDWESKFTKKPFDF
jgi:transposase-like protein